MQARSDCSRRWGVGYDQGGARISVCVRRAAGRKTSPFSQKICGDSSSCTGSIDPSGFPARGRRPPLSRARKLPAQGRIDAGQLSSNSGWRCRWPRPDAGCCARSPPAGRVGLGAAVVVVMLNRSQASRWNQAWLARPSSSWKILSRAVRKASTSSSRLPAWRDEGIEGAQRLDAGGCPAYRPSLVVVAVVPAVALANSGCSNRAARSPTPSAAGSHPRWLPISALLYRRWITARFLAETTEARSSAGKPLCGCASVSA